MLKHTMHVEVIFVFVKNSTDGETSFFIEQSHDII